MPIARSAVSDIQTPPKFFSTTFSGTENPISEGGLLRTGATHGLDWTDPQKTGGIAFGSQSIHSGPPFDDSVAFLSGYRPKQYCQATLFVGGSAANGQEVELFLLAKISAHVAVGIEIDILLAGARIFIAQWNGALSDASQLAGPFTTNVSVTTGAVWYTDVDPVTGIVTVKCNSNVVTTLNITGNSLLTAGGSPGFGFYRDNNGGTPGANDQFCWTDYQAGELV